MLLNVAYIKLFNDGIKFYGYPLNRLLVMIHQI